MVPLKPICGGAGQHPQGDAPAHFPGPSTDHAAVEGHLPADQAQEGAGVKTAVRIYDHGRGGRSNQREHQDDPRWVALGNVFPFVPKPGSGHGFRFLRTSVMGGLAKGN
jgi:hypothetical protein